jgi:hypothetical protein
MEPENFNNDSFVDDNAVCVIHERIIPALQQSLLSELVLFGWPTNDRRGSCIAPDKWDPLVSFIMLFLDYQINRCTCTVTWPSYKRKALLDEILAALAARSRCITPNLAASILGKIRSIYDVAPWGPYISFSLSEALKKATRAAFSNKRSWWACGKVRLLASVQGRFTISLHVVPLGTGVQPGLVPLHWLPRTPGCYPSIFSDVSYEGVGGWFPDFLVMWHLTREDLL